MDWLEYENKADEQGFNIVCGVGEAGRGPLAGPVVAAAVILKKGATFTYVDDSKKLTEKEREYAVKKIEKYKKSKNLKSRTEAFLKLMEEL